MKLSSTVVMCEYKNLNDTNEYTGKKTVHSNFGVNSGKTTEDDSDDHKIFRSKNYKAYILFSSFKWPRVSKE